MLSVFGLMFAPDPWQAAAELTRVCRPGGRIGLAAWRPDGFSGEMLAVVATHVPPPPALLSPVLWGDESHLRDLLRDRVDSLSCSVQKFTFRCSAQAFVDYFRTWPDTEGVYTATHR